jgi:hypothetical protein
VSCANPTHGRDRVKTSGIPPTAVGGLFKASLHGERADGFPFPLSSLPRGARERGITKTGGGAGRLCCRPYLNNPPTAVGGIPGVFAQSLPWVVFALPLQVSARRGRNKFLTVFCISSILEI